MSPAKRILQGDVQSLDTSPMPCPADRCGRLRTVRAVPSRWLPPLPTNDTASRTVRRPLETALRERGVGLRVAMLQSHRHDSFRISPPWAVALVSAMQAMFSTGQPPRSATGSPVIHCAMPFRSHAAATSMTGGQNLAVNTDRGNRRFPLLAVDSGDKVQFPGEIEFRKTRPARIVPSTMGD